MKYSKSCRFCNLGTNEKIIFKTKYFFLVKNLYSRIGDHFLLISKSHIRDETEMNISEWQNYKTAITEADHIICKRINIAPIIFINPKSFQSIKHFHRHFVSAKFGKLGVETALTEYLYRNTKNMPIKA